MRSITDRFLQPNNNCTIWRYMSLEQFLYMLKFKFLYLRRVDSFEDKFEGSLTRKTYDRLMESYKEKGLSEDVIKFRESCSRLHLRNYYVSCWHQAPHESAFMWQQYGAKEGAIAIRSSYRQLVTAIEDANADVNSEIYFGKVKYLTENQDISKHPHDDLDRCMHKKNAFKHENEIRVLMILPNGAIEGKYNNKGELCLPEDNAKKGKPIPIDLACLITEIRISPLALSSTKEILLDVIDAYNKRNNKVFSKPIKKSELTLNPTFDNIYFG